MPRAIITTISATLSFITTISRWLSTWVVILIPRNHSATSVLMNCRTAYHNVPIINGLEQKDGRKYRAEKVNHVFADGVSSLSLNLEKAYTEGAHVDKWQRTIALDREYNWVEVTEQYKLDSLQIEKDRLNGQVFDNQIILMAYGKPVVQKTGRILFQGGMVRLEYDAQYLSASVEKVQMTDGIMKTH